MLHQACRNKVSTGWFATGGLQQNGFQGQVRYSRLATTRFPGVGLLQRACHNKVSRGRFATAGLQQHGFQGQFCNNYVSRVATAGLQQKISRGRFATASLPQQGFQGQVCHSRLATKRLSGAGSLQQVCNGKVSRGRFVTAGLQNRNRNSNDRDSLVPTSNL